MNSRFKLLVAAPRSGMLPVGISYISAVLKKAGYQVHCHNYKSKNELAAVLQAGAYDFLATGGLSLQFSQIKDIIGSAKERRVKIILGGGIVTSEPELITRALGPDYSVIGEGEETALELLACLESGRDPALVPGLAFERGGKFIQTETRRPLVNLDSIPFPDYESFGFKESLDSMKPTDLYMYDLFDEPREYPIITSRSCPFLCTFCYHPAGNKYRERTVDSIMAELESVIPKYRINIVSIYDELFSFKEDRLLDFCRRFRALAAKITWDVKWSCQMRVSGLKETMLDAMRDSGCYLVSYGFESYSRIVLQSMKKYISPEEIHKAVHSTLDRKISIQANFIFGDPAETAATARETLEFWKEHPEAGILLGFIFVFPDSELYRYCREKRLITDRLRYIQSSLYDIMNMTRMPDAEFIRLRTLVEEYTNRYYVSAAAVRREPSGVTVKCPHCEKTIKYGNYRIKGFFYRKMMYCRECRKRFFATSGLYRFCAKLALFTFLPVVRNGYQLYFRLKPAMKKNRYLMGLYELMRPQW